jgi:hypothetical protein
MAPKVPTYNHSTLQYHNFHTQTNFENFLEHRHHEESASYQAFLLLAFALDPTGVPPAAHMTAVAAHMTAVAAHMTAAAAHMTAAAAHMTAAAAHMTAAAAHMTAAAAAHMTPSSTKQSKSAAHMTAGRDPVVVVC